MECVSISTLVYLGAAFQTAVILFIIILDFVCNFSELKRQQKAAQKAKDKANKETSKAVATADVTDEHKKVASKKAADHEIDPSDPTVLSFHRFSPHRLYVLIGIL